MSNEVVKNEVHEIAIVDSNDEKVFSLIKSEDTNKGAELTGKSKDSVISHVSSIINQIPNISKTAQSMNTYEAVFSKEMKDLMKSGVAVLRTDKEGNILPHIVHSGTEGRPDQIMKQVRLKSGVKPANLALMGWQIASMITAQKHLADINKKLDEISKDVKNISKFLEDEFFSEIEVSLQYSRNLMNNISKNPDFFEEYEKRIAITHVDNYNNNSKLISRLSKFIDRKIEEFKNKSFKSTKSDEILSSFNIYKNEIQSLLGVFLSLISAQHILVCTYDLYYKNATLHEEWFTNIEKHKDNLKEKFGRFDDLVDEKLQNLKQSTAWYKYPAIPSKLLTKASAYALNKIGWSSGFYELTDVSDALESMIKTDLEKEKYKQRETTKSEMATINLNINDTFSYMEDIQKNINEPQNLSIDMIGEKVVNVRLLN